MIGVFGGLLAYAIVAFFVHAAAKIFFRNEPKNDQQVLAALCALFWPIAMAILAFAYAVQMFHGASDYLAHSMGRMVHNTNHEVARAQLAEEEARRANENAAKHEKPHTPLTADDIRNIWEYPTCPKCYGFGCAKCNHTGVTRVKIRELSQKQITM